MAKTTIKPGYSAQSIEVLSGLDPVRRRPGMYTDTTRPNHLAHEAIDNSVDEAIAGFASQIDVTLHKDGSLSVLDNGRGMPIDKHPEHKITGVELILTRLHAGAKFTEDTYEFSGGLHGVGISVVNALSTRLVVQVKREGHIHEMQFKGGEKSTELKVIGDANKRESGTLVHFWPDEKYFDSVKFSVSALKSVLRAKAVLCPGLRVSFTEEKTGEVSRWFYEDGLKSYLQDRLDGALCLPEEPLIGSFSSDAEKADWAFTWLQEGGEIVGESYVNLIPTIQGGTHVNGLRTGILEAIREFCEIHKLLPRGVK
jgi:topoisomerase-4 subunit B